MKAVYEQYARDKFNSTPPISGNGTVKAIHYIQSFDPKSNITPELAHKITKAFVRKTFGDDVQAVIATHIDKKHCHSHIIINSYSLSGHKFYANKDSLKRVREYSDGVCRAFGIEPSPNFKGTGRNMEYNEWEHKKNSTSWKEQIRQTIDELIASVNSLDELLQALEERGYEVKREKYISIKAPGQQRFVRIKTLGEEYTEESLNIRIRYREVGSGSALTETPRSRLYTAYADIIGDVRVLADKHEKVPRKQNYILPYSADNDLDVYKLSAQLSVINRDKIGSIGELESKISRLKAEYEKEREEINRLLEDFNRMESICEQAQEYFTLSSKGDLSPSEQLKLTVYRQTLKQNGIHSPADADILHEQADQLNQKISALKENLEGCRQRYDVYSDIAATYCEISEVDYIGKLIEEEKRRREQDKRKRSKNR